MGEDVAASPKTVGEYHADSTELKEPEETQCPEWPEDRDGDHGQVQQVVCDPAPATRREIELCQVLDNKGCPDEEVDDHERFPYVSR
jgi:hypothetical protein